MYTPTLSCIHRYQIEKNARHICDIFRYCILISAGSRYILNTAFISQSKRNVVCTSMPRPKGSKNKVKSTIPTADFTSLIAEKSSTKEALVADIAALEENLTSIREELKAKKAELKKLETEVNKLEEQKAEMEAREAEEAKKAELEATIQKLMAEGVSAAEILEKLK